MQLRERSRLCWENGLRYLLPPMAILPICSSSSFSFLKKDQLIVIFHVGDLCELAGCTAKRIMVIQMILKRSWVLIVED